MSQVISAKVSIQIPDNFELINKEDYQKLKRESTFGRTWNLNDFVNGVEQITTMVKRKFLGKSKIFTGNASLNG